VIFGATPHPSFWWTIEQGLEPRDDDMFDEALVHAQGVINESNELSGTDLALALASLAKARRDLDAAMGCVSSALGRMRSQVTDKAPAGRKATNDFLSLTPSPVVPRPPGLGSHRAGCGKRPAHDVGSGQPWHMTPEVVDTADLPAFIDTALACTDQMRHQVCGQAVDEIASRLQLAAWCTHTCVTRLQKRIDSEKAEQGAWLTRFPVEIGTHILRMLPIDSHSNVAATCHALRRWSMQLLASRDTLTTDDVRNCTIFHRGESDGVDARTAELRGVNQVATWLSPKCTNLRRILLSGALELRDSSVVSLCTHARGLREVVISRCPQITDASVIALATYCTHLRCLDVGGCTAISNAAFLKVAAGCPALASLHVSGTLIADSPLRALSLHCPLLKVLDLSRCAYISELGVQPVVRRCANLESLDLSHCDGINDLFLGFNGLACSQLRQLRLRCCTGVTDAALLTAVLHCKELRILDVSMCVHLTDYSIGAVGLHCRFIEALYIDSCVAATAAAIVHLAEHLHTELLSISMRSVSTITDEAVGAIGVHCTSLRQLDLANCPRVGDEGLISVGFGCEQLIYLDVQSCERVTDASIVEICYGCVHLRHINLQWCPMVTDDSLEVISELCTDLESIWLTGSDGTITDTGITSIAHRCSRLRELHVRDCNTLADPTICVLSVSCPRLAQLDLRNCTRISDASILVVAMQCHKLVLINVEGCWRVSGQMMHAARKSNPHLCIVASASELRGAVERGVISTMGAVVDGDGVPGPGALPTHDAPPPVPGPAATTVHAAGHANLVMHMEAVDGMLTVGEVTNAPSDVQLEACESGPQGSEEYQ